MTQLNVVPETWVHIWAFFEINRLEYPLPCQELSLPDWGCGGGVGVECSAADTEVPGSIPGVDIDFSDSVSQALTLDVGLFYLSCTTC